METKNINLINEIAERKQAEAALLKSEARFRAVWQISSDAMALSDGQGVVLMANPAYCDLYGYPPEEIINHNFAVIFPPEKRNWAKEQYQLVFNMPQAPPAFESKIVQADGETRTVESRIGFITDGEERVAMLSSIRDITERVETETALRQSQASNRAMLDAMPDLIFRLNRDGDIIDFSAGDTRDLMLSPAYVIGSNITASMPPEVCEQTLTLTNQAIDTGEIQVFEYELAVKKGLQNFEARLVRVDDQQVLAVVRNITPQKQTMLALAQSEQTFRRTFMAIPDPALLWQREPDGRILMAAYNEAAEEMSEQNIARYLYQPLELFFERSPETIARIKETFETGQAQRVEIRYPMVTIEEIKWLIADYVKASDQYVLNIVRDVTEFRKLEEQKTEFENRLRQTQRLETIGTLAGGIAHDFNNLLTPIMGFAELAHNFLPEDHLVHNYLAQIERAGGRAKELVEQILVFSQQVEIDRTPVLLAPLITGVLQLLQLSIPPNVRVVKKIDTTCGPVLANPAQIDQVVMNLGTNALHAMEPNGGVLTVSLTQLNSEAIRALSHPDLKAQPYLKLSISDTGPGIDPVARNRIFEPFYSTKPVGKGTGLGLSVVHGIVKSHGGVVSVDSAPGRGTTFNVYLPLSRQTETQQTEDSPVLQGGVERLLLVDDETAIVELLSQALTRFGYTVTGCTTSEQALALCEQNPDAFDLILTDLSMPGMTGMQLARELMTRYKNLPPIILFTGHADNIPEDTLDNFNVKTVIKKPVSLIELDKTIRTVLAS